MSLKLRREYIFESTLTWALQVAVMLGLSTARGPNELSLLEVALSLATRAEYHTAEGLRGSYLVEVRD